MNSEEDTTANRFAPKSLQDTKDDTYDLIVVGSGFSGLTIIGRTTNELDKRALVIERHNHIGDSACSEAELETGIEACKYGVHLFHISNKRAWDYVNRFTDFIGYQYRVFVIYKDAAYWSSIGLGLINQFFGRHHSPDEVCQLIKDQTDRLDPNEVKNLEKKVISLIGRPPYEAFVKHYTAKQWQTDSKDLPARNITRLPVRCTFNNRYFNDTYEGLSVDGHTAWLESMVTPDKTDVVVGTNWLEMRDELRAAPPDVPVVHTGPPNHYSDYVEGKLGWCILGFEMEVLNTGGFQGTPAMNYDDTDVPYTRIHRLRHFHPERNYIKGKTVIVKEYSRFTDDDGEVYYPINTPEDREMLEVYRKLAATEVQENEILFGGRLDTYQYLNTRMAISSALSMPDNRIAPFLNDNEAIEQERGY